MNVFLKTITNKTVRCNVQPTDTLKVLQQQLEDQEGLTPQMTRLVYAGKLMADPDKTIAEYGIQDGATVHITMRIVKKDNDSE